MPYFRDPNRPIKWDKNKPPSPMPPLPPDENLPPEEYEKQFEEYAKRYREFALAEWYGPNWVTNPKYLEEKDKAEKMIQDSLQRRRRGELRWPKIPDPNLPPEEYVKAAAEYEEQVKDMILRDWFGLDYKNNPEYLKQKQYLDAQWEAVKDLF